MCNHLKMSMGDFSISEQTQGRIETTALLCTNEIPADRIAGVIERRSPARVQDGGDLPFINSHCLHLDVQPLVYFHF